jgi:hypothetical protein
MAQASTLLALEGGARVGGRQVHRLDVVPLQAGLVDRAHQQVVRAGAFLQRDLFALDVGQLASWANPQHQDGRAVGLGRLDADVEQVLAGGLREHRRRIAGQAELQAADGQRFQQLRAGREFAQLILVLGKRFSEHSRTA